MGDKRFTEAEVAAHSGQDGRAAWIVYRDGVYDVTAYVAEHPGGEVLLEEAGRDATAAFDDVGHSTDARAVLAKYKVGELVEEEKKYDANGKKKKRIVNVPADKPEGRSCINVVTCGLLG
ncbi:cytochrome b5-like [Aricia agestis]|uniref:cytochrome b5-like n=1 Tax=Aricia agestis TaxID=91739 RepID=UPI001C2096BB|nr:cytochrome b5-like [Aricia agestis]